MTRISAWRGVHPTLAMLIGLATMCAGSSFGQVPVVSDIQFLPGDAELGAPAEEQDWAHIAAGESSYLAVWQDVRSVLSGQVNTAYNPLTGNQTDIYAARIDGDGAVIDTCPIVIANEGRNQDYPQVEWNGESWLVVYKSERPDWYFFTDILARRVSSDGEILDANPISIRLEQNDPANDRGDYPSVVSDGTNLIVVWQDVTWQPNGVGWPNVSATRIAPDGTVLDNPPLVLYQHPTYSFGPNTPDISFNGETFLLVWERLGRSHGMRFDADLNPISAAPFEIGAGSYFIRVETNGTDFLLGDRDSRKVYRITAGGVVLDPAGISIPVPGGYTYRGPSMAWDGTDWVITISGNHTGGGGPDIWQARMHPNGTFGTVAAISPDGMEDQYKPAVASLGDGTSQAIWSSRRPSIESLETMEGAALGPAGTAGPEFLVSLGLDRQSYIRFASNGNEHLAVFESEGKEESQILAQRLDAAGNPIDLEPVIVGSIPEPRFPQPEVAWNGTHYLVTWTFAGSVYGRRLTADLALVDPAPVLLFTDNAGESAVTGLGNDFFVAYPHTFSGDQRDLKGVRVSGANLSLIGSPVVLGGNFALNPVARTIGGRALVIWERQTNHDIDTSTIRAIWVNADGTLGSSMTVSQSGDADYPDVALAEDRMLVSWMDELSTTDTSVKGRMLALDGSFLTPEFTINNETKEQMFPACGWSGSFFTVAWVDMRALGQVDQLRGDIYMARVEPDGTVLDPGGIQVTDTPLPEDLPAVVGRNGRCIVAFSQMHGSCGNPEVQRIGYLKLQELGASDVAVGTSEPFSLQSGPNPFRDQLQISWQLGALGGGSDPLELEIFGTDGRKLWSTSIDSKEGTLLWDGRTDRGNSAPNGAYFVRMRAGDRELDAVRVLRVQ